jgi:hypothetical protein
VLQLQRAAKLLDTGAVRATRFLWRHPVARVSLLFYLARTAQLLLSALDFSLSSSEFWLNLLHLHQVFVHLFLMHLLHRLQVGNHTFPIFSLFMVFWVRSLHMITSKQNLRITVFECDRTLCQEKWCRQAWGIWPVRSYLRLCRAARSGPFHSDSSSSCGVNPSYFLHSVSVN